MTPYLVTPPADMPVTLEEVKAHLRVVHDDEDDDITDKIAGAVAALDAWGGLLGRAIMPQTWAVDVTGPGPHLLPFPEASDVTAQGVGGALDVTVKRSFGGPLVTVADALSDEPIVVQFESGMSAERLPLAQSIVKLIVQREYDIMAGADYEAITRSIDALVNVVRWRRV
jgi:hypothetical protein